MKSYLPCRPLHSRHTHLLAVLGPGKSRSTSGPLHFSPLLSKRSSSFILRSYSHFFLSEPSLTTQEQPTPTWYSLPSKTCLNFLHSTCHHLALHVSAYVFITCLPLLVGKLHEDQGLSVGFTTVFPEPRSWWYLINVFK